MITVVKYYGCGRVEIHGLSTDEKPTEVAGIPVGNASIFYEMDKVNKKNRTFMFDEENQVWLEQ